VRFEVTAPFLRANYCHSCSEAPGDGPEASIRLGSLDRDPGIRPQYHSFVDSKAPWDAIHEDGLPRFSGRARTR